MDINVSYDASVAAAPSWFKTAVTDAVNALDALVTTAISFTVDFGWGEENNNGIPAGAASSSQSSGNYVDYNILRQALLSHETSAVDQSAVASLPASDPTSGGKFYVSLAEQKALGLTAATSAGVDGYVGLDSALNWSTTPGGSVAAGTYDPVGAIEHELTEIMGRVGFLGSGAGAGIYGPMDLFRYSAPGTRDLTPGPGSFSLDGQTLLLPFNDPTHGGDAADWSDTVTGDSFGSTFPGTTGALSSTDLNVLDVLGYSLSGSAPDTATNPTSTSASGGSSGSTGSTGSAASGHVARHFVFSSQPQDPTIKAFVATGSNHDVISLSSSDFSSIASILNHTRTQGRNAVITIDADHAITIDNVSAATLRAHPADFKLHA